MALATTLGAERELVDEMLRTRLRHPANTGEAAIAALLDAAFVSSAVAHAPTAALPPETALDPALKAAVDAADEAADQILVRLHKALLICVELKLTRADLRLLRTPAAGQRGFVALDFNTLPVSLDTTPASVSAPARLDGFAQLLKLAQLRAIAPGANDLLSQYAAINFDAVGSMDIAQTLLATGLGLEASEIGAAAAQLHVNSVEHFSDPITLTRLVELLIALKQLGATVAQAIELTAAAPDDASAIGARELLRSKYGAAQWHNLIKPIADALRERQRNALVDYLIDRDQQRAATIIRTQLSGADPQRSVDDLYERYLIDVQTSSCLKTTRLLQATAAAQLFVQRVILNLEKGWSLTPDKCERWEWMRSYRVWEANRKVFLFPENWLLPELRDDKTAIFRQMESVLTEQEPSPALARSALLSYLEELGDLAQISVIAMYEDQRKVDQTTVDVNGAASVIAGVERTLYVVGRTPNEPYRYFWRSCVEFGSAEKMAWSGWEALDVDNANDFIMPFVFEGDLHVAWPIFRKTTDERDETQLRWEVKIAWQRRTSQGWVKRKMSPQALSPIPRLIGITELRSFVFRVRKDELLIPMASDLRQERIMIDCYPAKDTAVAPDLTERVEHIPDPEHDTVALSNQKNVSLTVEAAVFEKYYPNPGDKVYVYRRANIGTLRLKYLQAHNDFQNTTTYRMDLQSPSVNGVVTFSNLAVQTHGELTPTIQYPELPAKKFRALALKDSTAIDATNWTWKPTFVIEIKTPADTPYYPSRAVVFGEVFESFRLTSSSDMEIFKPDPLEAPRLSVTQGMSRLGSQFIWTEGGSTVKLGGDGDLAVTTDFGPRVQLTPATVAMAPATNSPEIWYLQDATIRCYLRLGWNGWKVYPDGQDFVGWYRTVAAASAFALFDPRMQGRQRDGKQPPTVPTPQASTSLSTTAPAISFKPTSPYANYNWELFLHAPLAIADYLASQQRFEDARRWLHAVFDPTTETKDASNQRGQFWRFLPFNNAAQPKAIAKLLTWLSDPGKVDPKDAEEFKSLTTQIEAWQKSPFMPHVVARLRPSAYQWHTFFAYLELLIGWGDQLFRRDTRESVNEATLLYVLAAKLLGPRPRVIPAATPPHALTYRLLQANPNKLDGTSNAWVSYAELPGVKQLRGQASQARASAQASQLGAPTLPGRGEGVPLGLEQWAGKGATHLLTSLSALAFCIPQNEKVSEFYDRLEDRLFNVRNCRNIDGVFRDLPLYEPPIDPLLLIRARAAGVSISQAITGLYTPLPNYRFGFTLQKALELCAELKSLGGALLNALEKQDAEALTLLRSGHEIALLELVRETRAQQIAEAEANITALRQSEATIFERLGQYQKLLGKTSVTKDQDGQPVVEQSSSLTVSTDSVGESSELGLILMEVAQLNWTQKGNRHTQSANTAHVIAGVLSVLPNISIGGSVVSVSFGGSNLGSAASAVAKSIESTAIGANYFATQASTFAGYERRQDEWVYQSKLAVAELKQLGEQILAAQIRKEIAKRELSNHETQIENAQSVDAFMRDKFTSKELYRWMSSQLAQIYSSTYQLALDQARRAERAFQHELGLESPSKPFVRHGQWDTLKSGLLAGEQLHHDLKRMEVAYYEQNRREYELTKQISLAQLDPRALIDLKATGTCQIVLPEWLFDLDFPGHYFRRVKSVSITIPCVVGPYASVNATLTLGTNKVRTKPSPAGAQAYSDPSGHNYQTTFRSSQQIATSNAQQDSGMFELNFRDERYMPFEHAGVISSWTLELSGRWLDAKQGLIDLSQFDFETISDVVLHLRYTARQGSEELKQQALAALKTTLAKVAETPQHRLFSLRHEFPTEWHQLRTASDRSAGFGLHQGRFPLLVQRGVPKINRMDYIIVLKEPRPTLQVTLLVTKPGAASPLPALTKATTPLPALTEATKTARYWTQAQEQPETNVSARPEAANWQLTFIAPTTDSEIANIEDIVLVAHYTQ